MNYGKIHVTKFNILNISNYVVQGHWAATIAVHHRTLESRT